LLSDLTGRPPEGQAARRAPETHVVGPSAFQLLYQGREAQSITYDPTPIVVAAIIYFAMLWPVVRLLSRLENRALAGR